MKTSDTKPTLHRDVKSADPGTVLLTGRTFLLTPNNNSELNVFIQS